MCKRRGYCSERDVCKNVAEDVDSRQGGDGSESSWLNFRAFHDASKPHKASNKTTNAKLDGCAGHWVGESFKNLLVIAGKEKERENLAFKTLLCFVV